jgi:hypothetical protein
MRPDDEIGEALIAESLAGESQEGFKSSNLRKRLDRYGTARYNAVQFAGYLRQEEAAAEDELARDRLGKLRKALDDCGNYALFRDYYTIGQTRLESICTCKKHLICPLCAIRRGAKALKVYLARVQALREADKSLQAFLVTLTVKNGDDLGERFKHLAGSLRTYHKRRKGKGQRGEVLKASSAVWSYEFTNRGKGWHPHVHAIWLCHEKPDEFKLSAEWRELTGDSYIVDVRPLDDSDPVGAFCEVFKYALKFSDLDNPLRLHAYRTLRGKRLQDSFGELRGLDVEPGEGDDLLEDLPYIRRLFTFQGEVGFVEGYQTGEVFNVAA